MTNTPETDFRLGTVKVAGRWLGKQEALKNEFRCKVRRLGALSNDMQVRFACFLSSFLTAVSGWAATTFGPGQIVYENGDPTPMIESIVSFAMGRGEGFDLPHAFLVTDGEALYSQEQTAVGVFDDPVMLSGSLSGENRLKVITGDLDGLHGDDVVLLRGSEDVVEWYANKSGGGWETASAIDASGNVPLDAAIADLNGDGAKDLAVVMSGSFQCVWYEQDPVTHGFTKRALSGTTGDDTFPETIAIGDINGDTFPDIVTAARSPGEVFVYTGTSTPGSFATIASLLEHSPGVTNVRLHDVDDDDDLDLFVFEPFGVNSSLTLFKNDGSGNFFDPVIIFEGPASTWYTAYGGRSFGKADRASHASVAGRVSRIPERLGLIRNRLKVDLGRSGWPGRDSNRANHHCRGKNS